MKKLVFHILPNAHLDPVWLWDWREGLNEAMITTRTVLNLMDEFPDLTFMRGEATLYRHIEKHDPATFARIKKAVKSGRWEIIGGTWIQADNNLTGTETYARNFLVGQRYFKSRFGKQARVAWSADAFGHAAGLPEILVGAGMEGIAFTRIGAGMALPETQAFWWEGPSGARILAYRPIGAWYGIERDQACTRLDLVLRQANKGTLENWGVFVGLGNHGGGPTRRQIEDIRKWSAAHHEVKVIFSGVGTTVRLAQR